jgi:hypothetical protein
VFTTHNSAPVAMSTVWRRIAKNVLRCSYRLQQTYIRSREELPFFLNACGLLGEGAEIGVQTGYFSEVILRTWRGKRLYSIDPWRTFPQAGYQDAANVEQATHDGFYDQTVTRLRRFGCRSQVLRTTSREAAARFTDGQLDFAYLDAQHHYAAVKEDIQLWAGKVRKGGMLAGHDYLDGVLDGSVFGVKPAVDEFARDRGLRVIVSREREWQSWFLFMDK